MKIINSSEMFIALLRHLICSLRANRTTRDNAIARKTVRRLPCFQYQLTRLLSIGRDSLQPSTMSFPNLSALLATSMMLLAPEFTYKTAQAGDWNSMPTCAAYNVQGCRPADSEARIIAAYNHASPAIVRVKARDKGVLRSGTGAVVTDDGFVLVGPGFEGMRLVVQFPDGRHATAKSLGWSAEWGIALAQIDSPGPWPHVSLCKRRNVQAGQAIVTLAYPESESTDFVSQPLLDVNDVTKSASDSWFMTSEVPKLAWKQPGLAVDFNGQCVGIAVVTHLHHGTAYVGASTIRALWNDLKAGNNVDELRLDPTDRRLNDERVVKKTSIPHEIWQRVDAATVRIKRRPDDKGWSGVVITSDGIIATCAHHFEMPGTDLIVCFADGRNLKGIVTGINVPCDIGTVRVTDAGPFSHVDLGSSASVQPGDPCIFTGYGPTDINARHSLLRSTTVVAPPSGHWSHLLFTEPSTLFVGGDSGGGVFDQYGNLVGIHCRVGHVARDGDAAIPHTNPRAELFRKHWEELHSRLEQMSPRALVKSGIRVPSAIDRPRLSVVGIFDGAQPVAMGTVVGTHCKILTKASVLPEKPTCRLPDGRLVAATVVKTERALDLAVLTIDPLDMPAVVWSQRRDCPVGTRVVVSADESLAGFISSPAIAVAHERGSLPATLGENNHRLEVRELPDYALTPRASTFAPRPPQLLRKHDIILSIDGHPTADYEALAELLDPQNSNPIAVAGDPVHIVVIRGAERLDVRQVLSPPTWPRPVSQSVRSSGFARVYSVAAHSHSQLCGGPVFDSDGYAIGLAIAWRYDGWLLVIPAVTANTFAID